MELVKKNWSETDYKKFIKYLFILKDDEYKKFHSSLGINNDVIGIRTPILKDIARNIFKGDYKGFLNLCKSDYYEEITLYGLIIANIKDLDESIVYLDNYKNLIDNWASCDLFCSSYKIVSKNKDYFYRYIKQNIKSKKLWIRRLCFVLLLNYYIEDDYIYKIFELTDKYNTDDYYVEMAVAWLISICYIKYSSITKKYLENNKLNTFTHNKSIQKIRESKRVSLDLKDELCKLKRK